MASGYCLASSNSGVIGVASYISNSVVLTLQGDGVAVYDVTSKRPNGSWPLGFAHSDFSAPAVYDAESQRFFAATHSTASSTNSSTILSWPRTSPGGTLKQLAHAIPASVPCHSLHPLADLDTRTSASNDAIETAADGTTALDPPAIVAVMRNGGVALCSTTALLSESLEGVGQPVLAAAMAAHRSVHVLHRSSSKEGGVALSRHSIKGAKLRCESITQLAPPEASATAGASPIAGVCTSGRALVLYSDGTAAVYDMSSLTFFSSSTTTSAPLTPEFTRQFTGFLLDSSHPIRKPGKTPGKSSSKKRSKEEADEDAALASTPSPVSLVVLPRGLVVVVGWTGSLDSSAALRVVVLDVAYGGIQIAETLPAVEMGVASGAWSPSTSPLQGCGLRSSGSNVALAAGGGAYICSLQLQAPTLANLLGALSVNATTPQPSDATATIAATPLKQQKLKAQAAAVVAGAGAGVLSVTSGATSHSAALTAAARAALDDAELAHLAAPQSAAGGAVQYDFGGALPSASGGHIDALLCPADLTWEWPQAQGLQQVEITAWSALAGSASTAAQFEKLVKSTLDGYRKAHVPVSYQLLCRLLMTAAENEYWKSIDTLLTHQHPGSLAGCGSLPATLAAASRYTTLHLLLPHATDLNVDELSALLKVLLTPVESKDAKQAQQAYRASLKEQAEQAVLAAEAAVAGASQDMEARSAAARCAVGAVTGFSAAQVCLHPVLTSRQDPAVMLSTLRQLTTSQAVALLKYLSRWMHNYAHIIGDAYSSGGTTQLPNLALPCSLTVLEWISLTVDANMTKLLSKPAAAEVLMELQSLVVPQVAALKGLSRMKGVIEHIQCGAPLPAVATPSAQYTMEWLDLRVN